MDNSDDYFQDSLVLDENDLALLAAEEAKYAQSISQALPRVPDTLPPTKRQKLSHNQSSDDIVDVFLRPDGTYGVAGVVGQDEGDFSVPGNLITTLQPATEKVDRLRTSTLGNGRPLQRPSDQLSLLQTSKRAQHRSKSCRAPEATPNVSGSDRGASEGRPSELHREFESELADLKATVEMLKLENDKFKAALQDAETTRFAKEGEVTILRKKVEKAAQQHVEDLNKLKEARETASLEQSRIQKEMKQQVERLRTEYIFKQHEIDASIRKLGWSSKSKKTAFGSQMSPVPVPPAMRNWTSQKAFDETPSRRQQDITRFKTGAKLRPTISELKFPGFENSFLQSSPSNSPSRPRHAKGKTRELSTPRKRKESNAARDRSKSVVFSPVKVPTLTFKPPTEHAFDEFQVDDTIQDFEGDIGIHDGSPSSRSKSLRADSSPNIRQGEDNSVGDLGFSDDIDRDFLAEEGMFDGIDWNEELHFILFSHSHSVSNGLTFHFLLRADVPDQEYQRQCSAILETLGTKYRFPTLSDLMEVVADKLISMLLMLWRNNRPEHLQALFELLSSVMTYIPLFTPAILRSGFGNQDISEKLLHTFSGIATKSLRTKETMHGGLESCISLVHSMLKFLEAAVWTVPDELGSCLVPLIRSERTLLILLDNRQTSSVVTRTIKLLLLLASHPSLFHSLFSFTNQEIRGQSARNDSENSPRPPILERLSSFLVDHGPLSGPRVDEELFYILNFFHLLLIENPDSRAALLRSSSFIPCLIHYLTRLSAALWEDEDQVMRSSDLAKRIVQNMRYALLLLHQLATPIVADDTEPSDLDFRQKLFYAPQSGLTHMFIVMVGRLSYADPPDWLAAELQAEIEKLTEPARDLMDLLIEGPEGDSVWCAYQDAEGETVTGDEEMEARLLDADEHD